MTILYSVISRGTTVLVKFTECVGNFNEVTELILFKIPLKNNHTRTFPYGEYLVHYICEDGMIYMCYTDNEFKVKRALMFLDDIKQKFVDYYGSTMSTAAVYAMSSDFSKVLSAQMAIFTNSRQIDVKLDIEELREIALENCSK